MKHQLFEEWLFNDEALTPDQQESLQEHLQECNSCRSLAAAWTSVENELRQEPLETPAEGFAERWQQRLEAQQRRLHLRQSMAMLVFSISVAALALASLVLLVWPVLSSPELLLATWLYRLLELFTTVEEIPEAFFILFRTAAGAIPLIWWVVIAGILSELSVLWVVSYRYLTNPRRVIR